MSFSREPVLHALLDEYLKQGSEHWNSLLGQIEALGSKVASFVGSFVTPDADQKEIEYKGEDITSNKSKRENTCKQLKTAVFKNLHTFEGRISAAIDLGRRATLIQQKYHNKQALLKQKKVSSFVQFLHACRCIIIKDGLVEDARFTKFYGDYITQRRAELETAKSAYTKELLALAELGEEKSIKEAVESELLKKNTPMVHLKPEDVPDSARRKRKELDDLLAKYKRDLLDLAYLEEEKSIKEAVVSNLLVMYSFPSTHFASEFKSAELRVKDDRPWCLQPKFYEILFNEKIKAKNGDKYSSYEDYEKQVIEAFTKQADQLAKVINPKAESKLPEAPSASEKSTTLPSITQWLFSSSKDEKAAPVDGKENKSEASTDKLATEQKPTVPAANNTQELKLEPKPAVETKVEPVVTQPIVDIKPKSSPQQPIATPKPLTETKVEQKDSATSILTSLQAASSAKPLSRVEEKSPAASLAKNTTVVVVEEPAEAAEPELVLPRSERRKLEREKARQKLLSSQKDDQQKTASPSRKR